MLRFAVSHHQRKILVAGAASGGILLWKSSLLSDDSRTDLSDDTCLKEGAEQAVATYSSKPLLREEQLKRLKSGQQFDVLVVGGGCTGSGAALDAATRGLSTALIERYDFGSETSSRSTKLIWAGIRYIATAFSSLLRWRNVTRPMDALSDFMSEFKMVLGAHYERKIMLENNPHLTNWVPIAVPITSWISWPPPFGHPVFATAPLTLPALFKFYDSLSGFTCPPSHIMGKKRAMRKFPQLDEDAKYFQVFYEGQHNDARTCTYLALTAAEQGAAVANHVEMIRLLTDDKGKATGVTCRDNVTGEEFDVHGRAIIFCGGPFTDELRKLEDPNCQPAVAAAAGTHIVLPGYYCPGGIGMLDINTSDGRFLFFLPWQGSTLVGTTDRKGPAVSDVGPPEEEIKWILNEVQKYLSDDIKVRRADVLSAWQGFRPLASLDPNAPPGAPVSRDHVISTNPETGVTFITGGKWTTYREMAEDVVDRVIDLHGLQNAGPCVTSKLSLRGGEGYSRNVPVRLVQKYGVSENTAKHLARTYGMNAFDVCELAEPTNKGWPRFGHSLVEGYPYLDCEVTYACRNEMVCTLKDMLTLRMRIAYLNKDAALTVAPKVADLMAKDLKWSRRERNRQLQEAEDLLNTFGGPYPNKEAVEQNMKSIHDVRSLFRAMDHNESGYIDFAEFKGVVASLGFPFKNDKQAMRSFKKIDSHADGKITEEEFLSWWKSKKADKLKSNLGDKFKLSHDKLGEGAESRGAAFG